MAGVLMWAHSVKLPAQAPHKLNLDSTLMFTDSNCSKECIPLHLLHITVTVYYLCCINVLKENIYFFPHITANVNYFTTVLLKQIRVIKQMNSVFIEVNCSTTDEALH